jgi:hypothetical protein
MMKSRLLTVLLALLPLVTWGQGTVSGDVVAAPTFRFDGDNLIIETETANASIFYQMADLPNMDEATIQKISESLTVTADAQQSIYYDQSIELKKSVVLKALAAGEALSEVSVLVYDYESWQDLLKAIEYGTDVYGRAQGNTAVDATLLSNLAYALDESKMMYSERATINGFEAQNFSEKIMELAHQIEEMMTPATDATFDSNGVLTVGGAVTMAEALEYTGGGAEVAKTITAIVWNSTATLTNSDLQGLDNPNMLIYVNSQEQAPANRDNVIIGNDADGYLAKNIMLKDVESGNNDFYCPKAFTAEMISYTRNFQQQTEIGVCRGWESIALPFTVQTIVHEKNGLIAPFGNDASTKHFWLRQLISGESLAQATAIQANTPYLISMPNSDAYPAEFNQVGSVTFSSQNVEVPVTTDNASSMMDATTNTIIVFYPTMRRVAQSEELYALNVGSPQADYAEGSVFVAGLRDIRPFECYTWHHAHNPAPRYIPISELNGGTMGIESLTSALSEGEGAWYMIDGRKLQKMPTRKGVYIHNGKKVVVNKQ